MGIYDLSREDIANALTGEPKYRQDQIWHSIYSTSLGIENVSTLPKALRSKLLEDSRFNTQLEEIERWQTDRGRTIKFLYATRDGSKIESVLMHYKSRSTLCVSSQAGCAMKCVFCATGQMGFKRHLSAGEIAEQVMAANIECQNTDKNPKAGSQSGRLSNIVFMGMGEPLANYDELIKAIDKINNSIGIGIRHITVSTVGIVPGIIKLADEEVGVKLAISLHGADDKTRSELVPISRRYDLDSLIDACHYYISKTRRRISFEWAMMSGINDSIDQAEKLANIALSLGAHVNLIPLNPTPGYLVVGSNRERIMDFANYLESNGVATTIRDTRGNDIAAACGQLAATNLDVGKTKVELSKK
ncbi:MAG: 23S rRNA (adenine(2503)-C(2))-methyltransferase RlmN [Acidimicrobiales bacterium]|nr:23S rRNA (adenine(2503)-C(2))-methyltransferase RlmN [Acidimicrobiales bacterium]